MPIRIISLNNDWGFSSNINVSGINGVASDNSLDLGPNDITLSTASYAGKIKVGWVIGGGVVVATNGTNGIICALNDCATINTSNGFILKDTFECIVGTNVANANSTSNGIANVAAMKTNDSTLAKFPAAKVCDDYSDGGYSDWFLPAKDQLNYIYNFYDKCKSGNFFATFFVGFKSDMYWSSYSPDGSNAYCQSFVSGTSANGSGVFNVRAVRSF